MAIESITTTVPYRAPLQDRGGEKYHVEAYRTAAMTDTEAIQAAHDAGYADAIAVGVLGGWQVVFEAGKEYTDIEIIYFRAGAHFNFNGAVLTRGANRPNSTRMFTTTSTRWSSANDSPLTIFQNGRLNGNRANQGAYEAYELEQSHLIFLDADATYAGRLRVAIDNMVVEEVVADGVSVYNNVDVQITNLRAWNCWRGGLVCTGGHSRVQYANVYCGGDVHSSGVDLEVDSMGYGGSLRMDITGTNLIADGDFDLGAHDDSIVRLTNTTVAKPGFNIYANGGTIKVIGGSFAVGEQNASHNRIVQPTNVTFTGVDFTVTEIEEDAASGVADRTFVAANIYFGGGLTGGRLRFNDCTWSVAADIEATDTCYAVYMQPEPAANDNRVILNGGEIGAGYAIGCVMDQGGYLHVRGTHINAVTAVQWFGSAAYPANVVIDNVTYGPLCTVDMHIISYNAANKLEHRNYEIDESFNNFTSSAGLGDNQYIGRRVIRGAAAPVDGTSGDPGLPGDIWRIKTPVAGSPYEWVCTTGGSSGWAVAWKPLTAVAA